MPLVLLQESLHLWVGVPMTEALVALVWCAVAGIGIFLCILGCMAGVACGMWVSERVMASIERHQESRGREL